MKLSLIAGVAIAATATAAIAQPYYVRGDFNGCRNHAL